MGSDFSGGLKAGGIGADICCLDGCLIGCFGRGLAGALPLALGLELKSKMNWLPAFITGLGVDGTGGLKKPPELLVLLLT